MMMLRTFETVINELKLRRVQCKYNRLAPRACRYARGCQSRHYRTFFGAVRIWRGTLGLWCIR